MQDAQFLKGCPVWKGLEAAGFTTVGEGKTAGEKHGGSLFVPGAVFVVAYQGEAPGGKLDTDLVAAARM